MLDDLILLEKVLEPLTRLLPPPSIDRIGHHLHDESRLHFSVGGFVLAFRRGAGEGGHVAIKLGQFLAQALGGLSPDRERLFAAALRKLAPFGISRGIFMSIPQPAPISASIYTGIALKAAGIVRVMDRSSALTARC